MQTVSNSQQTSKREKLVDNDKRVTFKWLCLTIEAKNIPLPELRKTLWHMAAIAVLMMVATKAVERFL